MTTYLRDRRTAGTPDPAEVITATVGGKTFRAGRRTHAHLQATSQAVAAKGQRLVIVQGCYNTTVAASAGTHDADGCVDCYIEGSTFEAAQTTLRGLGWAAWYRPYTPGLWGAHIHMVSLGCPGAVGIYVPGQVDDYHGHRSGLKGHAPDRSWHPADIDSTVFDYPAFIEETDVTPDQQKQLDRIEEKLDDLDKVLKRITKSKNEVIAEVRKD